MNMSSYRDSVIGGALRLKGQHNQICSSKTKKLKKTKSLSSSCSSTQQQQQKQQQQNTTTTEESSLCSSSPSSSLFSSSSSSASSSSSSSCSSSSFSSLCSSSLADDNHSSVSLRQSSLYQHLTPAERAFKLAQQKREKQRVDKKLKLTHRQRMEKLNEHLASLSEHFDTPKVGPG
eukprot:GHVQ01042944.1.p1 GENE.GHVQ01042944.1~~GHVQ01042944.1.p1  ORF type:complete len:176 (+),score=64.11 GHVQ01042944.1:374-901(+)